MRLHLYYIKTKQNWFKKLKNTVQKVILHGEIKRVFFTNYERIQDSRKNLK